jgi:hypothetical protein
VIVNKRPEHKHFSAVVVVVVVVVAVPLKLIDGNVYGMPSYRVKEEKAPFVTCDGHGVVTVLKI